MVAFSGGSSPTTYLTARRTSSRSSSSGNPQYSCLSSRPGRSNACIDTKGYGGKHEAAFDTVPASSRRKMSRTFSSEPSLPRIHEKVFFSYVFYGKSCFELHALRLHFRFNTSNVKVSFEDYRSCTLCAPATSMDMV